MAWPRRSRCLAALRVGGSAVSVLILGIWLLSGWADAWCAWVRPEGGDSIGVGAGQVILGRTRQLPRLDIPKNREWKLTFHRTGRWEWWFRSERATLTGFSLTIVAAPLWMVFLATSVPTGWWWWRRWREGFGAGRCLECGYEVAGLGAGAACPECGRERA